MKLYLLKARIRILSKFQYVQRRKFSVEKRQRSLARQLSNKIFESSDPSQVFALLGLTTSIVVVSGVILLSSQPSHTVPNAGEPRSNSRIVKDGKFQLKRFTSFNTVNRVDQKITLNLVASVVAETIPKSALKHRYKFLSSLDDGAFGRVFKAKDILMSKEVAVKVVPHRKMSADEVYNEVDVLRRVRGHENILHLFQVLNCDSKYFLISELCTGGELLDVLRETAIFTENRASVLAKKLASALQHVHKCGFVHCDLKPENIVFGDKKFEEVNCKIIDFGVAYEFDRSKGELSEDTVERFVGTLAYSPPEIVHLTQGKGTENYPYDLSDYDLRKIDTWALGVVLYICLFGCHPFDVAGEGNESNLVDKVLNNEFSFDVHGPDFKISEVARNLLKGLLHPDPSKRFSTEEVLNHEWLEELNKQQYLDRLPNSWVNGGFQGGRNKGDELKLRHERFNSFVTEKATDAYVRALLIAALLNSDVEDEVHLSSKRFLSQAFDILDKERKGLVSISNLEEILQQTSSVEDIEDESVSAECINRDDFVMLARNQGCVSRKLATNERLFSQGAEPQGFYILTRGKCALEFDGRVFHVSSPGAVFGEIALDQALRKRAVTVRALEKCDVTYIPKDLFFRALAGSSALQTKLFEAARLQQARRVRGLIERLLVEKGDKLQKQSFKRGQYLYTAGQAPKNLYFIESGIVTALGQTENRAEFAEGPLTLGVAQRGKGDLTGSSIFFKRGKRYCSVQCLTDVEVSVLSIDQVEELLNSNKTLQFYLASQAQWRMEQWNMRIAEAERGLTEQQLLPILLEQNSDQLSRKMSYKSSSVTRYAKAVQKMKSQMYEAGHVVYRKGDKSEKFYVVNSGSAVAEFESDTGDTMITAQFQPGDHFGERSLLNNRNTQSMTVRCVGPCEILSMSKEEFFELMGTNDTPFAKALGKATRLRKHRWGQNILVLAQSEMSDSLLEDSRKEEANGDSNVESPTSPDLGIERVELEKGEQLYLRGDSCDAIYYVHAGELKFLNPNKGTPEESKWGQDGQVIFQPGDTLGLDSFGQKNKRHHTCYCLSQKCVVSKIPKSMLEHLIANNNYVSENLKKHFVQVAPLRELERSLEVDLNKEKEVGRERRLVRFFSSFYKEGNQDEEGKRHIAGKLSFSQVMEELSKS